MYPNTLLVGMKNSETIMEDIRESPQWCENRSILGQSHPPAGNTPKYNQTVTAKFYLHFPVYTYRMVYHSDIK